MDNAPVQEEPRDIDAEKAVLGAVFFEKSVYIGKGQGVQHNVGLFGHAYFAEAFSQSFSQWCHGVGGGGTTEDEAVIHVVLAFSHRRYDQ